MLYEISYTGAFWRQLRRINRTDQKRILDKIESLAENPKPHGVKDLKGTVNLFRIRVGDYRIIYEIQDEILLISILKVGNRREVYR